MTANGGSSSAVGSRLTAVEGRGGGAFLMPLVWPSSAASRERGVTIKERTFCMSTAKRTTMNKMNRERDLKEKRQLKQERKAQKKLAAAEAAAAGEADPSTEPAETVDTAPPA
jgi:hypothetical protein